MIKRLPRGYRKHVGARVEATQAYCHRRVERPFFAMVPVTVVEGRPRTC
jgi:hypothetical protein